MPRCIRCLPAMLLLLAAFPALAALPFSLKPRPRVLADPATITRLKATVFQPTDLNGALFPQSEGALSFAVYLAPKGSAGSDTDPILDGYDSGRSHLFVRHYDSQATGAADCPMQVAFQDPTDYVAAWTGHAACNAWHTLTLTWSAAGNEGQVILDGAVSKLSFKRAFAPSGQRLVFQGRGDSFDDLAVFSAAATTGTPLARFPFSEGNGDVVAASVGADQLRLVGRFSWIQRAAGDGAVTLERVSSGVSGRIEVMPPSLLVESFASLRTNADALVTKAAAGTILGSADAVTAHPIAFTSPVKTLGLAWLITDDDRYRTALFSFADQILAVAPDSGNDFTQAGRAAALGFVYDWLHADVLTRTRAATGKTYREDIATFVKATAQAQAVFICGSNATLTAQWGCSNGTPKPNAAGGHADDNNSRLAVAILALVDDFPELEPLAVALWDGDEKLMQPYRDYVCASGGHHFGYDYGGTYSQLGGVMAWRSATDLSPVRPYMSQLVYRSVYGLRSDGFFPAVGDAYRLSQTSEEVALPALVASALYGDPYAETFFQAQARGASGGSVVELLLWSAATARSPLTDLPLARHFQVAGQVVVRESWDYPTSALFELHSTSFQAGNHQHYDHNAFTLFYKAPLLVDAGIYDSYGTVHWHNWYRRTVAHNAITVFDPAEKFTLWGTQYSNDGGQKSVQEYPLLADSQPGGANFVRGVTRFESTSGYTYLEVDASAAYDASKIAQDRGAVRSVVWLPSVAGSVHPVFAVHDRVTKTAAKASLVTRFLLHSVNEPLPAGGTKTATCHWKVAGTTYSFVNGGGAAEVRTLLPANADVTKVGGFDGASDCRFLAWNASGVETSYPPLQANDPHFSPGTDVRYRDIGGWHLEVASPTPSQTEQFLHSVAVLDEGAAAPEATLLASTGAVAARVGKTAVVFAADGATSVSFDSPGDDGAAVVVGLAAESKFTVKAGSQVAVEPSSAGAFSSSAQGVLSFGIAELLSPPDAGTPVQPDAATLPEEDGGTSSIDSGAVAAADSGGLALDAGAAGPDAATASGSDGSVLPPATSGCGCSAGASACSPVLLLLAAALLRRGRDARHP